MPRGYYKLTGLPFKPKILLMKGSVPWNKDKKGYKIKDTSNMKGRTPWNKDKKFPFKERPNGKGKIPWNKDKHYKFKDTSNMKGHSGAGPHKSTQGFQKGHTPFNKGKKGFNSQEKHYNWKDGKTPNNQIIRHSIEYKLWGGAVYARDNYTDQKTGIRSGNLVAHHIQNFSSYPELRFAINNGITLSKESHREFHKRYGIKNNTLEQIEEFIGRKII